MAIIQFKGRSSEKEKVIKEFKEYKKKHYDDIELLNEISLFNEQDCIIILSVKTTK